MFDHNVPFVKLNKQRDRLDINHKNVTMQGVTETLMFLYLIQITSDNNIYVNSNINFYYNKQAFFKN